MNWQQQMNSFHHTMMDEINNLMYLDPNTRRVSALQMQYDLQDHLSSSYQSQIVGLSQNEILHYNSVIKDILDKLSSLSMSKAQYPFSIRAGMVDPNYQIENYSGVHSEYGGIFSTLKRYAKLRMYTTLPAMILCYYNTRSVLKTIGVSFIPNIYLIKGSIDFLEKDKKKKNPS